VVSFQTNTCYDCQRIQFVAEEQLFILPSQRFPYNIDVDDNVVNKAATRNMPTQKQTMSSSFAEILFSQLREQSWKDVLGTYMESEKFTSLANKIQSDIASGATVYPPVEDIFAALNLCPLDEIKCVIVGQDPYHQPKQGHGLAFSVQKGVVIPPSLKNIIKEAIDDVGIDAPQHGNLECWSKQGVLLLNAVLTVRRGEANSHAKMGWEEFADLIIRTVNDKTDSVVFLLWGKHATKLASCVDEARHNVIRTSHPSPLGATKTNTPFLGSRCFSRANEYLIEAGKTPIDWNII
jgi:uracil-DNA glycosylase